MLLDIEDPRIKIKLTFPKEGTVRLVLEYPRLPEYRERVLTALADLIRPKAQPTEPLDKNKEDESDVRR